MNASITTALRDASLLTNRAFVAGEWVTARDGKTIAVTDPFDGSLIAEVAALSRKEVIVSIDAAHIAQKASPPY